MPRALDLRLELVDVSPRIWRTLRVPAELRLDALHRAIQIVMGWGDDRLHVFEVGGKEYGPRDDDEDEETPPPPEWAGDGRNLSVADACAEGGGHVGYVYDFADEWRIDIRLIGEATSHAAAAVECIEGERNGPPQGIGGPRAYQELLTMWLQKGRRGVATDIAEALPRRFDPMGFDLAQANDRLREECPPKLSPSAPIIPKGGPEEQLLADLTLLVLFLGSREIAGGEREAWKNVRFEVLDALKSAGLIYTSPKLKSVVITASGIERAASLRDRLSPVLHNGPPGQPDAVT